MYIYLSLLNTYFYRCHFKHWVSSGSFHNRLREDRQVVMMLCSFRVIFIFMFLHVHVHKAKQGVDEHFLFCLTNEVATVASLVQHVWDVWHLLFMYFMLCKSWGRLLCFLCVFYDCMHTVFNLVSLQKVRAHLKIFKWLVECLNVSVGLVKVLKI